MNTYRQDPATRGRPSPASARRACVCIVEASLCAGSAWWHVGGRFGTRCKGSDGHGRGAGSGIRPEPGRSRSRESAGSVDKPTAPPAQFNTHHSLLSHFMCSWFPTILPFIVLCPCRIWVERA